MEILKENATPYNNLFMLGNRKIVLECDSPEDCRIADGSTINGFPIEVRKGAKWDDEMFKMEDDEDEHPKEWCVEFLLKDADYKKNYQRDPEAAVYQLNQFLNKSDIIHKGISDHFGTIVITVDDPSTFLIKSGDTWKSNCIVVRKNAQCEFPGGEYTLVEKINNDFRCAMLDLGYPYPVYLYSRIGLLGETIAISKEDYESNYEVPRNGMVDDDYMNNLRASEAPMGSNTELKEFIDSLPEEVDRTYDEIEALQCQGRDKPKKQLVKENKEQDKFNDKITIEITPYHRDNWLWVLKEIQDNPILLAAFNTGDFLAELGPILAKTFRGTEKYSPNAQPGDATKRLLDIIQHKLTKKD